MESRTTTDDCLRVLDVGTGTARIPVDVCSRANFIRFAAVDRASRALETAQRNITNSGLSHAIKAIRADAQLLPFADATFDAVISNSLLHHVVDRLAVLIELKRVLQPGGLLFIRDTLPGPDANRIAQILSNSRMSPDMAPANFAQESRAVPVIEEPRDLAQKAGIPRYCVRQFGPRHWVLAFRQPMTADSTPP